MPKDSVTGRTCHGIYYLVSVAVNLSVVCAEGKVTAFSMP